MGVLINSVIGWSSGAIDFVNVSVGFTGIIEQYGEQELRDNFGNSIAALAQAGVSDKTVFVFSAGNGHGDPCDPPDFTGHTDLCVSFVDGLGMTRYKVNARSADVDSGLPARISELRGHVIAVVAIRSDGRIASFSNRCGIAAQWCIAAPGQSIRTAYYGPDPVDSSPGARGAHTTSGISFAAPMATGALVVIKHYYRDQLSNTALVSRLLATANDRGIYANSSIYGHGLLDLDAALTPQGTQQVALGNRVGGPGVGLTQTGFTLGNALGDGLTQALAGQEVAAFSTEGLGREAPVSGGVLSWRPEGAPLGLRGGLVGERAGLLGSRTAGAFGHLAAGSAFAGIEGSARIDGWRLGAGAEIGTVNASADGGLIADVSPLTTSAFALQAMRPLGVDGGTFTLSLSQPLRVETGRARLSVPVGRTKGGAGTAPVRDGRSRTHGPADRGGGRMAPAARIAERAAPRCGLDPRSGPRRRRGPRPHAPRRTASRIVGPLRSGRSDALLRGERWDLRRPPPTTPS